MRVLLIEDDRVAAAATEMILKAEGYIVDLADMGEDGLDIAKLYDYDIILLDIMLPDIEGYEVLRRLRDSRIETPVLMLSGLASLDNKIRAFGLGGDDYIIKPYQKEELIARMQAVIRRSRGHAENTIRVGEIEIDLNEQTIHVGEKKVRMTNKEYQMMELLMVRKGQVITKDMFLNHLYNGIDEPEIKIIDVFMCKIRRKINEAASVEGYIETVWGSGYALREPSSAKVIAAQKMKEEKVRRAS